LSILELIPRLEALADLDERIRVLEEDLAVRRGGLDALKTEVAELRRRSDDSKVSIAAMEKTRNELQLEARQMQNQMEKSREKLGRSRNERESMAAQRELEELKRLVRDREDEVEKLSAVAEQAKAAVAKDEARHNELSAELAGTAEGALQTVQEKEQERETLHGERAAAVKLLPPLLYRRYESIRARRPKAIAKTSDGTCSGCNIAVPPMMFQKMLRSDEFEQCPQCKRILYYVPKTASAG
jgi:uncharacterized protein